MIKLESTTNLDLKNVLDKKNTLLGWVADDLNRFKPDLIYINRLEEADMNLNMVDYFSQNKKFRQAWHAYHFAGNIGIYHLYARDSVSPSSMRSVAKC